MPLIQEGESLKCQTYSNPLRAFYLISITIYLDFTREDHTQFTKAIRLQFPLI